MAMKHLERLMRPLVILACLICVGLRAFGQGPNDPVNADLLLRGGTLHLGDGRPAELGDVAIVADRIVALGRFTPGKVGKAIDCRGLIVSPGFIDLHNHSDRQVLQKETRAVVNYLTQGCTTIVTGNCGSGPIDAGDYYEQIDRLGVGVNVAHLLPQGALRREVMGTERRKASPDELAQMKRLVEQAMRDGVWGTSTGLIYVPSSYADTDELVELAKVVGRHGGIYASHIRNENVALLAAVDEALEIGRRADLAVHISHFKSSGKNAWGLVRDAADTIDRERRAGRRVTADQYPYTASSTSLDATLIPPWARAGGREMMLRRLDDEAQGARIRAAISEKLRETDGGQRIQIASYEPRPEWAGRRLAEIARTENLDPLALVLQIAGKGGASIVNHSINEQDVRFVMNRPWVATASDGRAYLPAATVPHPRNYGTFPRKIGYYAINEGVVPIEHAIRSATGLAADILGITDRGYLRTGYCADVIVWDPKRIKDTATFEDPHRYSQGVVYALVNGQLALTGGTPTGTLAGRALRRPTDDPSPQADAAPDARHAELGTWLDKHIPQYLADSKMPGFSIAVVKDGETIYAQGFGARDPERNLPATPDTLYGIGSITKSMVAIGIMQLVEQGKIGLDDPVRQHIPFQLGLEDHPITVHHLLTHSLGIPSLASSTVALYRGLGLDTGVPFSSADDFYRFINGAENEIVAKPGQRFFYHNAAWRMLGHIIQEQTGMPFHQYLEENVIAPLGMERTTLSVKRFLADPDHIVPHRRKADGSHEVSRFPYPDPDDNPEFSFLTGAGGVISSVNDMARYMVAQIERGDHGHGRLARRASFEKMQRLHIRTPDGHYGRRGYGYGLSVTTDFLGHEMVSHGGSILVSTAYMAFIPELKAGVVMMGNASGMPYATIAESVLAVLMGEDPVEVIPALKVKRRMKTLAGKYEVYLGLEKLKVLIKNGMLYLEVKNRFGGTRLTPLIPQDPMLASTEFYTLANGIKTPVEFHRREDGGVDLFLGRYCYHKVQ